MTKTEYTINFVSENMNEENMNEKSVDVYGMLDGEIKQELDYHVFRTSWKHYREELNTNQD